MHHDDIIRRSSLLVDGFRHTVTHDFIRQNGRRQNKKKTHSSNSTSLSSIIIIIIIFRRTTTIKSTSNATGCERTNKLPVLTAYYVMTKHTVRWMEQTRTDYYYLGEKYRDKNPQLLASRITTPCPYSRGALLPQHVSLLTYVYFQVQEGSQKTNQPHARSLLASQSKAAPQLQKVGGQKNAQRTQQPSKHPFNQMIFIYYRSLLTVFSSPRPVLSAPFVRFSKKNKTIATILYGRRRPLSSK